MPKRERHERYDLERSPLAQKPTQRDIAALVGESHGDLLRFIWFRDQFVVRRTTVVGKKTRQLAYPVAGLRRVHERLKMHLNKIKQPAYLFSPRKSRSQRDNAALHVGQRQFLTLDVKQFYPSTTASMVRRFFIGLGMANDVAGLLVKLITIDGVVSFGSPLTPVLCTLVHRQMFDQIAEVCAARGLIFSVWVDDLTISGDFVPGEVLAQIREIVRGAGLRTHKIEYRNGSDPVFVTGVGIVGRSLIPQESLNFRIKGHWGEFYGATTDEERRASIDKLLAHIGTVRYIRGAATPAGRKASDVMNSLRQKRDKIFRKDAEDARAALSRAKEVGLATDLPFDL